MKWLHLHPLAVMAIVISAVVFVAGSFILAALLSLPE